MELLLVGLATGFAAGVGLATWWSLRAAQAEHRAEARRPLVERFGLLTWRGNTVSVRGTAREVVQAVTVEGPPATEREPDTWRSR